MNEEYRKKEDIKICKFCVMYINICKCISGSHKMVSYILCFKC